jgi:hypothetical protein
MQINSNQFELSLATQVMFSLPDAADVQIVCRHGSLWITLDHDLRDVVLGSGDTFMTTEHRRALIYAIAPSSLSLSGR